MKRLVLAMCLVACGGEEEPTLDDEACVIFSGGPFQALVAGATRDTSAPSIDDDHVAYEIDGDGFVVFGAAAAAEYHFFYDASASVEYTGEDGAIEPEASEGGGCAPIVQRDTVAVEVGTTYLELRGNGGVSLVVLVADHGHDEADAR